MPSRCKLQGRPTSRSRCVGRYSGTLFSVEEALMPRSNGWLYPRASICAAALLSVAGPAAAEGGGMGPWEIEAVYRNGAFDRCAIRRVLDSEISATFLKTPNAMTLLLSSPHWQLEFGKSYPVSIKLGPQRWENQVGADVNSVSMAIEGPKFLSGLREARALDVVAAGATIRVPLDGSAAAFERLDRCVAESGNLRAANSGTLRTGAVTSEDTTGPETAAAVDGKPPRPPAKPGPDPAAEDVTSTEPAAPSAEGPTTPPARPEIEAEAEEASTDDAASASTSEEQNASPPAAKQKAETAKKANPPKKRSTPSSAQSAKRAFQREIERLRSFFGN